MPIDYVEFESDRPSESRAFFAAAFGWRFTEYGPDYLGIEGADLDGGIARAGKPKPPLIIVYADDLDAAEAAVRGAGGEITRGQFDFPGGRRFHFREPGGNELAVWSRPSSAEGS
ncbi:VOC family protein [Pelagibacterium lacus]|uniref:VOC family protein n=1 Tax=Pelagibacterium lacus TaxID=2282655 RepID=A0A369W2F9_9HYPH|nr:VOC family protein [Pelagibacterium lacus]